MDYQITLMYPTHVEKTVTRADLPAEYAQLKTANAPNVSWGEDTDRSLIVQVADDYCVVSMASDDDYFYLQTSDDDELVTIIMGGVDGQVPKGALVDRELGLEALLRVDDWPALLTEYTWVSAY
ncbi:hypothetical protein ABH920_002433 [Catenulispora sp. EB89]|uniref:hypothetical protein n=1 Tax=Catenulispora sp. EB89 TaxID=3156257 RepID=UPI0035163F04